MTDIILSSLLIASLCTIGGFFLKLWEAKKTISELKKEILCLQTETGQSARQEIEKAIKREKEITEIKNENSELRSHETELEAQNRTLRFPPRPEPAQVRAVKRMWKHGIGN
ncbi:MAG: hypothetical protein PHW60_12490 [Kiritimatiellae bacterium]|nr:hypothetical protein [Kiritimatiellia bacterium]